MSGLKTKAWRLLKPLTNAGLRGLSLSGRFVLTLYIAKYMDIRSVGDFGLISGATVIGPALLGMGFNFYLNREIAGTPPEFHVRLIRDRLTISVVSAICAAFTIMLLCIPFAPQIPWLTRILFGLIFIMEVAAFDLHMSLVTLNRPVLANLLQFTRSALWVFPYTAGAVVFPSCRTMDALLVAWLIGLVLNLGITYFGLRDWPWAQVAAHKFDSRWFSDRIRRTWFVYMGDIALITIQQLDRVAVAAVLGMTATGIYVFYNSFANAVQLLTAAAVLQMTLPGLLGQAKHGDGPSWRRILMQGAAKSAVVSIVISAIAFPVIGIIVTYLNRQELNDHRLLFLAMLVAVPLRSIAELLGSGLYTIKQDRAFVWSNIIGAVASTALITSASALWGMTGTGCAVIASGLVVLLLRLYLLVRGYAGSFAGRLPAVEQAA
ncbi:MAG: hypothetical protein U0892_11505 [Pirellulales bacterium]